MIDPNTGVDMEKTRRGGRYRRTISPGNKSDATTNNTYNPKACEI